MSNPRQWNMKGAMVCPLCYDQWCSENRGYIQKTIHEKQSTSMNNINHILAIKLTLGICEGNRGTKHRIGARKPESARK